MEQHFDNLIDWFNTSENHVNKYGNGGKLRPREGNTQGEPVTRPVAANNLGQLNSEEKSEEDDLVLNGDRNGHAMQERDGGNGGFQHFDYSHVMMVCSNWKWTFLVLMEIWIFTTSVIGLLKLIDSLNK